MLRSKSPDLVQQEIWGHLCCHYAIRTLMTDTALHTGPDPDRVFFVKAFRVVCRSVTQGSFFPLSSLSARTRSGVVRSPGSPATSTREDSHERTRAS